TQAAFDAWAGALDPVGAWFLAVLFPGFASEEQLAAIRGPAERQVGGIVRGGRAPKPIEITNFRVEDACATLEVSWDETYPLPGDAIDFFGIPDLLLPHWQRVLERPLSPTELASRTCEVSFDLSDSQWLPSGFFCTANKWDSDGDGLSDAMEILVVGSDPDKWSSIDDGLPDGWKYFNGFDVWNPNVAMGDDDGDGLLNIEEWLLGTDPNNEDTDGDGLPDKLEVQIRTDPINPDTDGDGLTDYEEYVIYMTNPRQYDYDGDGLSDGQEIALGTSPFDSDTDGDGIGDYREVMELHSNPLSRDTDGDGMDDYYEYRYRNYGLNILNPSDAGDDWDEDNFSNLFEYTWRWAHITKAYSNVVVSYKIVFTSAGQYPSLSANLLSDSGKWSIYALGSHPTLSARMRIPTSTQMNNTNIAKRLYFTSVPGIFLTVCPSIPCPAPSSSRTAAGTKSMRSLPRRRRWERPPISGSATTRARRTPFRCMSVSRKSRKPN
ncbi:MAG: hypothetical protein FWH21_06565, partial [Kiritimatiellaeota bacterium]|nr:hypothetical protein [Kiritimatiellota bacterium]